MNSTTATRSNSNHQSTRRAVASGLARPALPAGADSFLGGVPTTDRFGAQQAFRVVPARAGDHHDIHALLVSILHHPNSSEFHAQLDDPHYEPSDRLLVKRNQQIVAHARISNREMHFAGSRMPISTLSDLVVLPEYRSEGCAAELVRAAEQLIVANGSRMAFLRTRQPEFFARHGWTIGVRHSYSIAGARDILSRLQQQETPTQNPLAPNAVPLNIRMWRHVELAALIRLYSQRVHNSFGPLARSDAYWQWLVSRRAYDSIYVAIEGPDKLELDDALTPIIRGGFETICYETATHLGRAASSAIINQSNERNASIIDGHGRLAGVSVGIPQLLFISPLSVRWGLEHFEADAWGPGDVFVGNDPDFGGGHLPDYNVYAPCFGDDGRVVAIQALQAHQGDTGGKDPGGFSVDAVEIYQEGMMIPRLKLVHRGEPRKDAIEMLVRNNRLPSFGGDIAAMISASQMGASRIGEMVEKWGADVIRAAINWNIAETERRFRAEVERWPDGTYEADVFIDHDTVGNEDVQVHVACRVEGDQLTVDLTGSDARPELTCVWNTFSNSRGYAMAQLVSMVDPTIIKNEGLFDAVEMVLPEGTIVQPPPNKPAALGAFHPACEIGEAICIALSEILPDRSSPQVYKLGMPNAVIGFERAGADVDGPGRGRARLGRIRDPGRRWLGLDVQRTRQPDARPGRGCGEPLPGDQSLARDDHRYRRRRSLARPAGHQERQAGPRADHRGGLDGFEEAPAARASRRRRCGSLLELLRGRDRQRVRGRELDRRSAAGRCGDRVPVRRRRWIRESARSRSRAGVRGRARRVRERRGGS